VQFLDFTRNSAAARTVDVWVHMCIDRIIDCLVFRPSLTMFLLPVLAWLCTLKARYWTTWFGSQRCCQVSYSPASIPLFFWFSSMELLLGGLQLPSLGQALKLCWRLPACFAWRVYH